MVITWTSIKSFLREAVSIAGLVVGIGNQLHLAPTAQAALIGVSGWLQVIQHQIDNPTTPLGGGGVK